jgi:hypothetical protein
MTFLRLKNKKNCLFFFLLFAAFVAPPDIFYQLLISTFLYFSFEFFLFFILVCYKYKKYKEIYEKGGGCEMSEISNFTVLDTIYCDSSGKIYGPLILDG